MSETNTTINYYILKDNAIALFDTDYERLKNTLMFSPNGLSSDAEILSTDREITVIDGVPVFADEHTDELLEQAKEAKHLELEKKSALFEDNLNKDMYFTSSVGFRVNGDRRTRSNLEDLIAYSQSFPVKYRDYDNNTQSVTKEQLQTMLVEHITNGNNLYEQKWEFEEKINACTTVDEVDAISIEFEMMNFSE